MAEIVNLNRFRKAKAKAKAAETAASNRVRFGRTKAEREAERRHADKRDGELDGKKIED